MNHSSCRSFTAFLGSQLPVHDSRGLSTRVNINVWSNKRFTKRVTIGAVLARIIPINIDDRVISTTVYGLLPRTLAVSGRALRSRLAIVSSSARSWLRHKPLADCPGFLFAEETVGFVVRRVRWWLVFLVSFSHPYIRGGVGGLFRSAMIIPFSSFATNLEVETTCFCISPLASSSPPSFPTISDLSRSVSLAKDGNSE